MGNTAATKKGDSAENGGAQPKLSRQTSSSSAVTGEQTITLIYPCFL
ncbi:hypothetical protein BIW11_04077 [Tropilaelaps mercedesae]|uniref:Uncharacterized protein n=1 Tax=Tropilaelaps mercedesae TaxID=418985 RepID=A0A1V9XBX8_9ACAR|nr:hypothetical protein BIW11_04077 [Tropilaelaps mercedesae]